MSEWINRLIESKRAYRAKLAALPFEGELLPPRGYALSSIHTFLSLEANSLRTIFAPLKKRSK